VPSITYVSYNGQNICGAYFVNYSPFKSVEMLIAIQIYLTAKFSVTEKHVDVTGTSQSRQKGLAGFAPVVSGSCSGCLSCVYDDQCDCKYLHAQNMSCNNLIESWFFIIGGTWSFYLTLPFSGPVNSWTAIITFSTPIESLSEQGNHNVTPYGTTGFQISNTTADADQCRESVVYLMLLAKGVTSSTVITAITVNGQTVCTGQEGCH
jgi:hypothetical protein